MVVKLTKKLANYVLLLTFCDIFVGKLINENCSKLKGCMSYARGRIAQSHQKDSKAAD